MKRDFNMQEWIKRWREQNPLSAFEHYPKAKRGPKPKTSMLREKK